MILAMIAALALPLAAPADDFAVNEADLRCLAGMAVALGNAEGDTANALNLGMIYYLGKIDGRTPDFDVEDGIRRLLVDDPSGSSLAGELGRCGTELQKRGKDMIAIGEALQAN